MIRYLSTTKVDCLSPFHFLSQTKRSRVWPLLLLMGATCSASAEPQIDPPAENSSASAAASESIYKGFSWPASTRIRYLISGQYRGEIQGSAKVDWFNLGQRYQVQVETLVGPPIAPVLRRTATSNGEIGMRGLVPRFYEEVTRIGNSPPRRRFVIFDGIEVRFSEGSRQELRLAGAQDSASQYMQFAYALSTVPSKLSAGQVLVMPMALSSKQTRKTFEVIGIEQLDTAIGPLPAVHIKSREASSASSKAHAVEWWFAPSLEYLPVRMRLWSDEVSYVDMLISSAPQRIVDSPDATH